MRSLLLYGALILICFNWAASLNHANDTSDIIVAPHDFSISDNSRGAGGYGGYRCRHHGGRCVVDGSCETHGMKEKCYEKDGIKYTCCAKHKKYGCPVNRNRPCKDAGGFCTKKKKACAPGGHISKCNCRGRNKGFCCVPDCGGVYSSSTGTISHYNYTINESCTWIIMADQPIIIAFISFETERGYDFLYVQDGEGTELGVFSGSSVPSPIPILPNNTAYLNFTSDYIGTYEGFEIQWEPAGCGGVYGYNRGIISHYNYQNNENCTWIIRADQHFYTFISFETEYCCDHLYLRDGEGAELGVFHGSGVIVLLDCGGVYSSSNGTISHYNYQNNENCTWIIRADQPIIITFISFEIESCCDDLYLRDGEGTVLGEFSGSSVPSPIPVTNNTAYLHFTSDSSVTYEGFEIQWEPAEV